MRILLMTSLAMNPDQLVAGPKPEELPSLSGELTPMGSERAGNTDGSIPDWTGGITQPPAGYQPGDHHPDPFHDDPVLYTIDQTNHEQYRDMLTVGQIAMLEKYPTFRLRVYPSRRSASFPELVYEKTLKNGGTATLAAGGEGVENAENGFPFPFPENAFELIWNHKLKYKGSGALRYNNQAVPTADGKYNLTVIREEWLGTYYLPGQTVSDINNILLYFFQEVESPARLAGNILLVHETLNQQLQPRQAWSYNPGQRRVRRAPNVAYDNPGTASDGLRTFDMVDMFNGAMDRFDWEVVGRRELLVPYNSYKIHAGDLTTDEILQPGHLNPELLRYELHRAWVIEARLRNGVRHINARRTFYLDEDSYQILQIDHYDDRDTLWRVSEAHCINYYEVPTFWSTVEVHYDLQSGRYLAQGLDNSFPMYQFNLPFQVSQFTPQALRSRGRR